MTDYTVISYYSPAHFKVVHELYEKVFSKGYYYGSGSYRGDVLDHVRGTAYPTYMDLLINFIKKKAIDVTKIDPTVINADLNQTSIDGVNVTSADVPDAVAPSVVTPSVVAPCINPSDAATSTTTDTKIDEMKLTGTCPICADAINIEIAGSNDSDVTDRNSSIESINIMTIDSEPPKQLELGSEAEHSKPSGSDS